MPVVPGLMLLVASLVEPPSARPRQCLHRQGVDRSGLALLSRLPGR